MPQKLRRWSLFGRAVLPDRASDLPDQQDFLGRDFFARSTTAVARELVGCRLVVQATSSLQVIATLTEVEAYLGMDDPASHAFRGPTQRAGIMFGPPGHLYVYLSYGVHFCANLVAHEDGKAGAVLLRSASVDKGEEVVKERRGATHETGWLRGPGNLTRGLDIRRADNGMDICAPASRIRLTAGMSHELAVTRRVGITRAIDDPLRFFWKDHPAVSRPTFE